MNSNFKRVSVIGLGYIGLPTAATIASRGIDVVGVDTNSQIVNFLSEGRAHFSEPDLDILLQSTVATGKLRAVSKPEEADAFLIAVPTPILPDRKADLSYVEDACRSLAKVLKPGDLVILESTCPVGTTLRMCEWIQCERTDLRLPHRYPNAPQINIAYCPERILPGQMLFELVHNDRIIGGVTTTCAQRAANLYEIFVRGNLHTADAGIAELVKLLENAYRDVNIAFANEVSVICEQFKLDAWQAITLANRHPRVNILNPGPGVGGHCIAVDPWFLISAAPKHSPLMSAARSVNDGKPRVVLEKVRRQIGRFRDPVVACLGLAYKPDVDDIRESPALRIVQELALEGVAKILVVEPHLAQLPEALDGVGSIEKLELAEAIERADIILLLVGHRKFRHVDTRKIYERVIIDTVGLWQLPPSTHGPS